MRNILRRRVWMVVYLLMSRVWFSTGGLGISSLLKAMEVETPSPARLRRVFLTASANIAALDIPNPPEIDLIR